MNQCHVTEYEQTLPPLQRDLDAKRVKDANMIQASEKKHGRREKRKAKGGEGGGDEYIQHVPGPGPASSAAHLRLGQTQWLRPVFPTRQSH
jgi:hypothetical protein